MTKEIVYMLKIEKQKNGKFTLSFKQKAKTRDGFVELFSISNMLGSDMVEYLTQNGYDELDVEAGYDLLTNEEKTTLYFTAKGELYHAM